MSASSPSGTGPLSADRKTLALASARIVADAFVGLNDGATAPLTFLFRADG